MPGRRGAGQIKPTVIVIALLALAGPALAAPAPDAKLLTAVKACDKDARMLMDVGHDPKSQ